MRSAITTLALASAGLACGAPEPERRCAGVVERADVDDSARAFLKSSTWEFFAGDVDGDGHPDIIVPREGEHFILPRPRPLLADPGIVPAALLPGEHGLHLYCSAPECTTAPHRGHRGDVDGDGRDDVFISVQQPTGGALVVLFTPADPRTSVDVLDVGQGVPGLWLYTDNPAFQDSGRGPEHIAPSIAAIVDIDLDGRAELVLSEEYTANEGEHWEILTIIPGGRGSRVTSIRDIQGTTSIPGSSARAGDLDGDGYPELVVEHLEGELTIHAGPAMAKRTTIADPAASPYFYTSSHWIADDIDGDGLRDVVIHRNYDYPSTRWQATVLFGPVADDLELADVGDAGFVITAPGASERVVHSFAPLGDFDGDGRTDIAVRLPVPDPLEVATTGSFVLYAKAGAAPVVLDDFPGPFDGFTIPWHTGNLGAVDDLNGDDRAELRITVFEDTSGEPLDYIFFGTECP